MNRYWPILILALLLSACGPDSALREDRNDNKNVSRKGIDTDIAAACGCQVEFIPVCGADHRTYDSACIASCLEVRYNTGACQNGGSLNCSSIVQYVCAQPKQECPGGGQVACPAVMPAQKTYLNLCRMAEDNATFVSHGACPAM